jgi:hypothetical protein
MTANDTQTAPQEAYVKWVNGAIAAGAGFFLLALIPSAIFDPSIRVLHTLQALVYISVIVLTRRKKAWGYGAGFATAALWNYTNLFFTSFIRDGWRYLWLLLQTGRLKHPDLIVAVVAAGGHFLMIAACVAGFALLRPTPQRWLSFFAGGVLAILYFAAIIITTGLQYIPLLRRVFHL